MPVFHYRAYNPAGKIIDGTIRATDEKTAFQQLEGDRLIPVEIQSAAARKSPWSLNLFAPKIEPEEIIIFTRQLSTLLKAGIPILQVIETLRSQASNKTFKAILAAVGKNITGGSSLSESLAEFPRAFPGQYINIVVAGEKGADLVQALLSMADWMERELEIKSEIKTALRYPIMVVAALIGAAILMVSFVIPKFALFFSKTSVPLPLPTRILLGINACFQHYWPVAIGVLILLGAGVFFLLRVPFIRLQCDRLKFHLPIFGKLYREITISRFARIFAMLIKNGVPVIKALETAPAVTSNLFFEQQARAVLESLQSGSTIADGFASHMYIFPPMVTDLVAIGEKSGSLDTMMEHVVYQYDMDIKYSLKRLTSMIEPVITLILGVVVLFLALSVFLPMWNMARIIK